MCFDLFEQRFRFGERCRIIGSVPGLFQDLQNMHFFLVGQVDLDFICVFIVISPCYFYNVTIFIIAPKERILNTISQTTDKYDRFSRMLRPAPRRRHGVLDLFPRFRAKSKSAAARSVSDSCVLFLLRCGCAVLRLRGGLQRAVIIAGRGAAVDEEGGTADEGALRRRRGPSRAYKLPQNPAARRKGPRPQNRRSEYRPRRRDRPGSRRSCNPGPVPARGA